MFSMLNALFQPKFASFLKLPILSRIKKIVRHILHQVRQEVYRKTFMNVINMRDISSRLPTNSFVGVNFCHLMTKNEEERKSTS